MASFHVYVRPARVVKAPPCRKEERARHRQRATGMKVSTPDLSSTDNNGRKNKIKATQDKQSNLKYMQQDMHNTGAHGM